MEKKIIAPYIGDGGVEFIRPEDIKKVSILFYAFTGFENGRVHADSYKNIEKMKSFKDINPDIKLIFSVGGWGKGGFSIASATQEGRALFASTSAAIVEEHGFDGIDIDWEYPCSKAAGIDYSPDDKVNYTLLLKEIRQSLDSLSQKTGKKYLLTTAVGAGKYYIDGTEMDKAVEYLDYVNLMTYDMRGGFAKTTGHHTNLYPQQGKLEPSTVGIVEMYHKAGVPMEKMIIGAAFYGRMWKEVDNASNSDGLNCAAGTPGSFYVYYPDVEKLIKSGELQRYWDDDAKAPYGYNQAESRFVSYDDEESIKYKCDYLKNSALAGIMFWEFDCDPSYTLINALYKNLE